MTECIKGITALVIATIIAIAVWLCLKSRPMIMDAPSKAIPEYQQKRKERAREKREERMREADRAAEQEAEDAAYQGELDWPDQEDL